VGGFRGPGRPPGPGYALDARYNHDHWYPARGYAFGSLPVGSVSIGYHGSNYFYRAGVWYRPYGGRYIVDLPPPGIFVPLLPPAYSTVWYSGRSYYYANGVYYTAAPGQGYTVVDAPPGVETAEAAPPAPAPVSAVPEPIVYPRNGQSPQQTDADRAECNVWAGGQPNAASNISVFQRGFAACLDGRGYTVR
jgi:hypothetical protein